ncbi:hypothetical protein SAMD00019534_074590 [Acytostelium subglobosum LB1]|uniref:hypothetical protein n=1 Tax=Acytostelium subglobosum LB1 TaxID=1410327 RepID=UPI000644F65C|nr:hypothetical protein SAMD00019534_074590 [Acytostelium subglobosum LB1]GAM24284.1 hypothetical protein SAMD00019534_074590 [Acytostelium subglobosum LB1]|eukprot:XP_012752610.1 hypothetical protein SAMD00019534_074590 [Acytostelium subglobosum LB1]
MKRTEDNAHYENVATDDIDNGEEIHDDEVMADVTNWDDDACRPSDDTGETSSGDDVATSTTSTTIGGQLQQLLNNNNNIEDQQYQHITTTTDDYELDFEHEHDDRDQLRLRKQDVNDVVEVVATMRQSGSVSDDDDGGGGLEVEAEQMKDDIRLINDIRERSSSAVSESSASSYSSADGAAILSYDKRDKDEYDSDDKALLTSTTSLEDVKLTTTTTTTQPRGSLFTKRNLKTATIVILIANLGFGTCFSYTSPEAMSSTFYRTFNLDSRQFGSLFTLYAIPNVIMVCLTGVLVDIVGPHPMSLILSSIVTISTLIGALSPPYFGVMVLSRFILGFAGESLLACSNALMTKWFSDKQLSTFLGVSIGWIYAGNVASLILLPIVNKSIGFRWSLWVIFIVAATGLTLNIVYILIHRMFKDISKDAEVDILLKDMTNKNVEDVEEEEYFVDHNEEDRRIKTQRRAQVSLSCILSTITASASRVKGIVVQLPARLWVMIGIVFFGYSSMYGLAIIGPDFFEIKFGVNEQVASLVLSSEQVCSTLLSPVFGYLIRRIGRRVLLLGVAFVLLAAGILLLVLTDIHPLPWVILAGTGFSLLNTTVISSLPVFVPPAVLGTSYGLVGTAYNTGLVIYPVLLGSLKVATGSYNVSWFVLFGNCICGLGLVLVLRWLDAKAPIETRLSVN